jgi:hypothetical protein
MAIFEKKKKEKKFFIFFFYLTSTTSANAKLPWNTISHCDNSYRSDIHTII